jgi:uncharacterized protein with GYD domain
MSTYVLLLTLTPEGQRLALDRPEHLLQAEAEATVPGVQALGLYAVLGDYDFVTIVDAESNEAVARFSIELGVKAGVHVTTLPAIPISRLEQETTEPSARAAVQRAETQTTTPDLTPEEPHPPGTNLF